MAKRILLLLLLLGTLFPCFSQTIKITDLESFQDSVLVRFDLQDASEERTYTVRLYALINSDTLHLQHVRGAGLGDNISPGSYEVMWNALAELKRLRADVNFYITAVPSFFVDNPVEGQKVVIGNPITFQWFGGNSYLDELTLELYQYDTPIDTISLVSGTSQYTWKVPKEIKPGAGYRIKFMGTPKTGIEAFSNNFVIKRNTPLWAILVPAGALIAGTAAYFLFFKKPLPVPPGDLDE